MEATVQPTVRLRGVSKVYRGGPVEVPVLESVDLAIPPGAFEAFMRPSGRYS